MLSEKLIELLSDGTKLLPDVVSAVIGTLYDPPAESFNLACQVLFTLEEINADINLNHTINERITSLVVNGEYLLFKLYESYGKINMNPFLSHFLYVYRDGLQLGVATDAASRLHRIQSTLISLFLSGEEYKMLESMSSFQFCERFDGLIRRVDYADFRVFNGAIGLPDTHIEAVSAAVDNVEERNEEDYRLMRELLGRAMIEELSETEIETTSRLMNNDTTLITSAIDLSPEAMTSLLKMNSDLGVSILTLLLTTDSRTEILDVLKLLPPTLFVLEMLNHLLVAFPPSHFLEKDEKSELLHSFLSNATRVIENHHCDEGEKQNISDEIGGQTRLVQLLCLFIQSLLRTDAIKLEDYIYEVQSLTIRFMYVPEARTLFQVAQNTMNERPKTGQTPRSGTRLTSVHG
ncbi:hypothetical protein V1512DRAFT_261303 [Lipomyces arxii]|uniref:uncharacterized protein n=1 Tax=Lipomyces arxii TaxID=56418 RepID=UPI0034CDF5AF